MSHVQSILLDGDGRRLVHPYPGMLGVMSKPLRRSQCRALIAMFERDGQSVHSSMGSTLWVILEHCASQRIPYRLTARPRVGFLVEKLPKEFS